MRTTILIFGLCGLSLSYSHAASEADIRLKEAAGKPLVAGYCSQFHSLDYIEMNAPFLKRANWQATTGHGGADPGGRCRSDRRVSDA